MRFDQAYGGWQAGRLTQEEAAQLLGLCARSFRRHIDRYHEAGMEGLLDKPLSQVSQRRAPVDEVLALTEQYRKRHLGWSAKHFHAWYQRGGGGRSYTWVKRLLQAAQLVPNEYLHRDRLRALEHQRHVWQPVDLSHHYRAINQHLRLGH